MVLHGGTTLYFSYTVTFHRQPFAIFLCTANKTSKRPSIYDVHTVPRQFVCGHFVYDTSFTDISSTDISSTVYQHTRQLYIQLRFQQIIIFINSNFYLHYDSFLSIVIALTM